MGGQVPKQYLQLHGQPLMAHTLNVLGTHPRISGVMVALHPEDGWYETVEPHLKSFNCWRANGGKERADSVVNALDALLTHASRDDWVLVHDAARPCLRAADIDQLIAEVTAQGIGGIVGAAVSDTVKRVDAQGRVHETVSREGLFRALTPQMFKLGELRDAINSALSRGLVVTDEASAMEHVGVKPLLVRGFADNIKVTEPADLELASMYLTSHVGS